jgi:uncharacterized repeat protein (TIGR02543 family)
MSLKKAVSLWGIIACAAFIIFTMVSCGDSTDSSGPETVSIKEIVGPGRPTADQSPVTSFDNNKQYSGTVTWSPAIDGTFAPSTVYTATITLTPKPGYTMRGVKADFFTLSDLAGAETVSNPANSGVVTAVFPPTGTLPITIRAIEGLTIPVTGEIPVTEITETAQFTGTVTWLPAVNGTFAAHTFYTATITITPKTGYYIPTGRWAVSFTVEGADMVSNDADSGVVIARFPQTGGTINIPAIRGLTVPVTGEIPVTVIYNAQHTGTVTWSPVVNGTFAGATIYTATVTITPRTSYTLEGVPADFFTVEEADTVSNDANSGVITVTFPHTIGPITIAAISGLTVPVTGEIPVTEIAENEQYSGTVTWRPYIENGVFAASTAYEASVVLSPKTGYTQAGIPANFYTVEGANTVTNYANSGHVSVKFPQTGSLFGGFEYYWVDQHGSLVTSSNGSAAVAAGQTLTITAQGPGYVVKQWYLNGINTGQSGNTFNFSDTTVGKKHTISLFVEKDGKLYNTNIVITIGTYTVTYDINGGTGTPPPSQTAIYRGNVVSIAGGNGFSKSGYGFGGWNTRADGKGYTDYNAGDSYTPTANVTLYAKWNMNGSEANPFPLTAGVWTNDVIINGFFWYSFNAVKGTRYYIWWNDSKSGDSTKTLDVKASAYFTGGSTGSTALFTDIDSGWASRSFIASENGVIKIKVVPYNSYSSGSFAITYTTTGTRP